MKNYERDILALNDGDLEQFVREWIGRKAGDYVQVTTFGGSGDRGRDVVGFRSANFHEGPWHNFQCKQYGRPVPTETALNEIGKILYFASEGAFTPPKKYVFVAPRGVNRNLEDLLFNPAKFKSQFIADWDKYCAEGIIKDKVIPLTGNFKALVEAFDFSNINRVALSDILCDTHVTPVLHRWFGADLGAPPTGQVPPEVQSTELRYVAQLVDAYSEKDGMTYSGHQEIVGHHAHGPHLERQRERFYAADAFKRFYRDNTEPEILEAFEKDIFHGVIDAHEGGHADSLTRVDAVMKQASTVQAAGPLASYARVPVKQGVCHHFANEDLLKWRR